MCRLKRSSSFEGSLADRTGLISSKASRIFFIFLSYYPKDSANDVSHGGFVRRSVYEFLAHFCHSLNQSQRVGLFRQFDGPKKEQCRSNSASFGAFDLPPLQKSM